MANVIVTVLGVAALSNNIGSPVIPQTVSVSATGVAGTSSTSTPVLVSTYPATGSSATSTAGTGSSLTGSSNSFPSSATGTGTIGNVSIATTIPIAGSIIDITCTQNSPVVTVTHINHGAFNGDFVEFIDAFFGTLPSSYDPLIALLEEVHEISNVGSNSYEITLSANAGFNLTNSGFMEADYLLNGGSLTQVYGTGWGAGTWGRNGWGQAASTNITITSGLRIWSQDNFGEDLILLPRDGELYIWRENDGFTTRAPSIASLSADANVPLKNRQVMVTSDRHVVVFGTTPQGSTDLDRLLIRFSDQENPYEWTATATNTAGDLRVEDGTQIVQAVKTRREVLVLTDRSVHSMQFIGPPFTFGINQISSNTSAISPNGAVAVEDNVFWMGKDRFYVYSGRVQVVPCTVLDHVFQDLNESQFEKIVAGVNSEFGEVIWYYPSANSDENDRYVVYNYEQQIWYTGNFGRTAWVDRGIFEYPIGAVETLLYSHEKGNDEDGTAMSSFIESSPLDIGEGDQFAFIQRLIPDISFAKSSSGATKQATFTLKGERFPGTGYDTSKSVVVTEGDTQDYVRVRGRAFGLRVESSDAEVNWRLGSPRVEVRTDGRR